MGKNEGNKIWNVMKVRWSIYPNASLSKTQRYWIKDPNDSSALAEE